MNASASARGHADSVVAGGGGAACRGATGTGGGEKRLLKALEGSDRSAVGAGTELFGCRRLFTRPINSCGWNGLRINSSAFTETALSATLLLITPDINTTGVEPNSGCCFMCVQTEYPSWSGMITSVMTTSGRFTSNCARADAASAQVITFIFSRRNAILMTSRIVALSSMK